MTRLSLLFLALLWSAPDLVRSAEPAVTPASPGSSISGTATIELRKGTVQYLNGLGIALVPDEAYAEIKKIRNEHWLLRASRANFDDGFHNLDLDAIGGAAVNRALVITKADQTGKFSFQGIKPGAYRLYAQYRSHYAVAYWLIPVTVKTNGPDMTVNINMANVEEAYNLFK